MDSIFPGAAAAANLHPMIVHFPIALWTVGGGAWFVSLARRDDAAWRFGLWLQLLATAGAVVAVAAGFWATEQMGHDASGHDKVHLHRDFMLVATSLAVIVTGVGWWKRDGGRGWRIGLGASSLVLVVLMILGADRGAELVYRYGTGVAQTAESHGHADQHGHASAHDHDDEVDLGEHGEHEH